MVLLYTKYGFENNLHRKVNLMYDPGLVSILLGQFYIISIFVV